MGQKLHADLNPGYNTNWECFTGYSIYYCLESRR